MQLFNLEKGIHETFPIIYYQSTITVVPFPISLYKTNNFHCLSVWSLRKFSADSLQHQSSSSSVSTVCPFSQWGGCCPLFQQWTGAGLCEVQHCQGKQKGGIQGRLTTSPFQPFSSWTESTLICMHTHRETLTNTHRSPRGCVGAHVPCPVAKECTGMSLPMFLHLRPHKEACTVKERTKLYM